jgi:hypothetical protein
MLSFLTDLQIDLVVAAVAFVAGVVFSTKIKDWVKGVPAELRTALSGAETASLSAIETAQHDVLAKLLPAPAVAKVAAAPVAKVAAPAAPAPAAAAPVAAAAPAPAAPAATA